MTITVYYATNRNETGTDASPSFGPNFHQKGPQYLRFGSAEVEPPPTAPAATTGDVRPSGARTDHRAGTRRRPCSAAGRSSRSCAPDMKTQEADLILLIHGYSSDFTTALHASRRSSRNTAAPADRWRSPSSPGRPTAR